MSAPNLLVSRSLSTSSNMSSFVMVSTTHSSSGPASDESDDEIIYSISKDPPLSANDSLDSTGTSDNDFVVLSRPKSQRSIMVSEISTPNHNNDARTDASGITDLTTSLANLSLTGSIPGRRQKAKAPPAAVVVTGPIAKGKKSKTQPPSIAKGKKLAKTQPSPINPAAPFKRATEPTTSPVTEKHSAVKKKKSRKVKKEKAMGLGGRSIVDDVSDKLSDHGENDTGSPSMYEEAFGFITSFLSNPAARQDSACRLTLLQALIIELGLATPSLPSSLTAAKAYLKSRAFINIKEYIAVRDQGPAAVQRIMHPSRSALIKDIRKNKKKKAPLGWVKDSGLQVLLVQCSH